MDVSPLRRPNGDPACADLLHRARVALEAAQNRLIDTLACTPIGEVRRPLLQSEWTNNHALIQALHAVAPPRTRVRDDAA